MTVQNSFDVNQNHHDKWYKNVHFVCATVQTLDPSTRLMGRQFKRQGYSATAQDNYVPCFIA